MLYKKIPEWFMLANDKSSIESKEVAGLLGIHTAKLYKEVYCGKFPKPDYTLVSGRENNRRRWNVSTIRKVLQERKIY